MEFDQAGFDVRCEWGWTGLARLAPRSDVVVIVDILSFSTCVDVAVRNGAAVYPYRWRDATAVEFAQSIGAELADAPRETGDGYSLSPVSLRSIPAGTRLVLPSPNGGALSLQAGRLPVLTGCLRNAGAVARAAERLGGRIAVIPAGEVWDEGSLRPAVEDLIGAGAIIEHLAGSLSPEAEAAAAAFARLRRNLVESIKDSGSGRELIERGREIDVELSAALDVSDAAPILRDGAYVLFGG